MSIVAWILLGVAAGLAAHQLAGKRGVGLIPAILLGVFGAAVTGFAFNTLAGRDDGRMGLWGLVVPLVGAGAVLAVSSTITGRRVPAPVRIRRAKRIRIQR